MGLHFVRRGNLRAQWGRTRILIVVEGYMWRSKVLVGLMFLLVAACGKNDGFVSSTPAGYVPPNYGPNPNQPYPPQVNNQIPPGYPSQFQPFAPMYNYFQQTYQQTMWSQLWSQWQTYAYYHQTQSYNFNSFWNDFCPQYFYQTQNYDTYLYIDVNIY